MAIVRLPGLLTIWIVTVASLPLFAVDGSPGRSVEGLTQVFT